MVIKVFYSSTSGNMEIKSHQAFVEQIMKVKKFDFEKIDITNPDLEEDKKYMRANAKPRSPNPNPLPPQIFNGDQYCGDYDDFYEANEIEELEKFLKLSSAEMTGKASDQSSNYSCGYSSVQSNGHSNGQTNGHGFVAGSDDASTSV